MKSEIRKNATFTLGDSLDLNMVASGGRVIPSMLDDPQPESVLGDTLDLDKPMASVLDLHYDYTEAQIHGVDVSDIDEIVFHEEVSDSVLRSLERLKIPYRQIQRKEIGRPEKAGR